MAPTQIASQVTPQTRGSRTTRSAGSRSGSNKSNRTAPTRLTSAMSKSTAERRRKAELTRRIVPALAARRYHLPGNDWSHDWVQWFRNNHPLLGICFHHKLHPVRMGQRVVMLIGSIAFGLAATCLVYLWFMQTGRDMNEEAFSVTIGGDTGNSTLSTSYREVRVTHGMIVLWTAGSAMHTMFDLTIWRVSACACCQHGGSLEFMGCCRNWGSYVVVIIVALLVAFSTFVVVLRATVESRNKDGQGSGFDDDTVDWGEIENIDDFAFIVGYGIELFLALFVYNFLIGTIFFSGVCGCCPMMGGRPNELKRLNSEKNLGQSERSSRADEDFFDDTI